MLWKKKSISSPSSGGVVGCSSRRLGGVINSRYYPPFQYGSVFLLDRLGRSNTYQPTVIDGVTAQSINSSSKPSGSLFS